MQVPCTASASAKDSNQLSVYDGEMIDPADSWRHYTGELNLESAGVLAVSVTECKTLELRVTPDPDAFPEHALIDFGSAGRLQLERTSKKLREYAMSRGWKYRH